MIMNQLTRLTKWMIIVALVVAILPTAFLPKAEAQWSFFQPDNGVIAGTGNIAPGSIGGILLDSGQVDRTKIFLSSSPTLDLAGNFFNISPTGMSLKVDQFNFTGTAWAADATHSYTRPVTAVSGSTNRFAANALNLYSGVNRITMTGLQGTNERVDVFYVLYDSAPYLQSLQVLSGSDTFESNSGSPIVVSTESITLVGVAKNATEISVQGITYTPAANSGSFFFAGIRLKPGINQLDFTIRNSENTVVLNRTIYYYKTAEPYTSLTITHLSDPITELLYRSTRPILTVGTATYQTADLAVQVLVPVVDAAKTFAANSTVLVNNQATAYLVAPTETNIVGSDGSTVRYKLVNFTLDDIPFTGGGTPDQNQVFTISLVYDSLPAVLFDAKFRFLPGDVAITKMYILPGYAGVGTIDAIKVPMNEGGVTEVSNSTFYVLTETTAAPGPQTLQGKLLPLLSGLTVTNILTIAQAGATPDREVYQVTGFPGGQQNVQFKYSGSLGTYNTGITYSSKAFISTNIYDGQSFSFSSAILTNTVTVTGAFINFDTIAVGSTAYSINGIGQSVLTPTFSLSLQVGAVNGLVYGENILIFNAINTDATLTQTVLTKEIRIYVVDTNIPVIEKFIPTIAPTSGLITLNDTTLSNSTTMSTLFASTPDIQKVDAKFTTTLMSYSLIFKASGATSISLKRNSDTILQLPSTTFSSAGIATTFATSIDGVATNISYHAAGDSSNFVIRINNLPFDSQGSHVYELEVTNAAGARTTERLEIERIVTAYTVLAPKPTVGERIVVNKNFVHLDIEAEGATEILIGKDSATLTNPNGPGAARFEYDYVGLKANKETPIKFDIVRADKKTSSSINVYYADTVQVDSQYMEPLSTKHRVFDGGIALTFPKGTILKSQTPNPTTNLTKYYTDTNLRFGIANPNTGVVGERDDYNNAPTVWSSLQTRFTDPTPRLHFTRISPAYWISGGLGEFGNRGIDGWYLPATDGLTPFTNIIDQSFGFYPTERKVVPTNRGKITLAFDDNVVSASSSNVAVLFLDDSNRWVNLGGEVSTKDNTISVPFDNFGYYMVVTLKLGFSDMTNHPWARNVLTGLYAKGIMTNLRSNEFGTEDFITRGEFATLIVKSLNIPLNYDLDNTFSDVPPLSTDNVANPTWDYKYVETAARAGIIKGLDNGFFGVTQRITREETAIIIARALQLKVPVNDAKLDASLSKSFIDSGNMAFYAKSSIEAVFKAKIMLGNSSIVPGEKKPVVSFLPKSNLSRAEAGTIAVKMLQKVSNIFPKDLN
ncbi:MAG: S-layer homology domain-containing protein [Paenibacillaceae bacterium]